MITCSCGFTETTDETLADHLGEMFIPDDDIDEASQPHAETDDRTCLCGHVAATAADLDVHLLAAFTSPDHLGRDGRAHNLVQQEPECPAALG